MQKFNVISTNDFDHRSVSEGPYCLIDADNNQFYYLDGFLHRENEPAAIYADGYLEYYKEGLLHNINGPAVIDEDYVEFWHKGTKIDCSNLEDFKIHMIMFRRADLKVFQ